MLSGEGSTNELPTPLSPNPTSASTTILILHCIRCHIQYVVYLFFKTIQLELKFCSAKVKYTTKQRFILKQVVTVFHQFVVSKIMNFLHYFLAYIFIDIFLLFIMLLSANHVYYQLMLHVAGDTSDSTFNEKPFQFYLIKQLKACLHETSRQYYIFAINEQCLWYKVLNWNVKSIFILVTRRVSGVEYFNIDAIVNVKILNCRCRYY